MATTACIVQAVVASPHTAVAILHTVVAIPHTVVAILHTVVASPHTVVAILHTFVGPYIYKVVLILVLVLLIFLSILKLEMLFHSSSYVLSGPRQIHGLVYKHCCPLNN